MCVTGAGWVGGYVGANTVATGVGIHGMLQIYVLVPCDLECFIAQFKTYGHPNNIVFKGCYYSICTIRNARFCS